MAAARAATTIDGGGVTDAMGECWSIKTVYPIGTKGCVPNVQVSCSGACDGLYSSWVPIGHFRQMFSISAGGMEYSRWGWGEEKRREIDET